MLYIRSQSNSDLLKSNMSHWDNPKIPLFSATLILFTLFNATLCTSSSSTCTVNLDHVKDGGNFPLMATVEGDIVHAQSINSDRERIVKIEDGSELIFECHGPNSRQSHFGSGRGKVSQIRTKCEKRRLKVKNTGRSIRASSLQCSSRQEPEVKRTPNARCAKQGADGRTNALNNLALIKVGWKINGIFSAQFSCCVDEAVYGTLWCKHSIQGEDIQNSHVRRGWRPKFLVDNSDLSENTFADIEKKSQITKSYYKSSQVKIVEAAFGSNEGPDGEPIIDASKGSRTYLVKGHLVPEPDFASELEQNATYFYFNAAPQFHSFNSGNWQKLEDRIRKYATESKAELEVYTGTFGQLQLRHKSGDTWPVSMFDSSGDSGPGYIPAPKYFWKVVNNPRAKETVAFIGLNDVHAENGSEIRKLCRGNCSEIEWLSQRWSQEEREDLKRGVIQCCNLKELNSAIANSPRLRNGILVASRSSEEGNCVLDLDGYKEKDIKPIPFSNGKFAYDISKNNETGKRELKIANNDDLQLLCHGSDNLPNKFEATSVKDLQVNFSANATSSVQLTCQDGAFKDSGGNKVKKALLNKLVCTEEHIPYVLVQYESNCATGQGESKYLVAGIGWRDPEDRYHKQIEVCFDDLDDDVVWTRHSVSGGAISQQDKTPGRPNFKWEVMDHAKNKSSRFYSPEVGSNSKVNAAYSQSNQKSIGKAIMGAPSSSFIQPKKSFYFARGHLAPDADFVYDALQDATYYFINVAPQFQSFNNGNWKALEGKVRKYAAKVSRDVTVYTGIHGVISVNAKDEEAPFYLYKDKEGNALIHPPTFYWKVVYDEEINEAIAVVGVNNPHLESQPEPICNNVCLTEDVKDSMFCWESMPTLTKGFSYACSAEDLYKAISTAPDLSDDNGNWPSIIKADKKAKAEEQSN